MKIINAVKFIFPGISENERTARAVVSAFLVQLDPTVEELADIRTAVSEAVTNAIVHGYRQCSGDVELHIKLLENREIYLRIKDHGCGITDVAQAMQPLPQQRSSILASILRPSSSSLAVVTSSSVSMRGMSTSGVTFIGSP